MSAVSVMGSVPCEKRKTRELAHSRARALSLSLSLLCKDTARRCQTTSQEDSPHKNLDLALAGVAQWTECRSANQRVAG